MISKISILEDFDEGIMNETEIPKNEKRSQAMKDHSEAISQINAFYQKFYDNCPNKIKSEAYKRITEREKSTGQGESRGAINVLHALGSGLI